MIDRLEPLVIRHRLRVPTPTGPVGEGAAAARQLDAVLLSVEFKLSAELRERLSGLSEETVVRIAGRTLRTVRELVAS